MKCDYRCEKTEMVGQDCKTCPGASAASAGYPLPVDIGPVVRQLEDLARWFGNPKEQESRHIVTRFGHPNMLLRMIANELRTKNEIRG